MGEVGRSRNQGLEVEGRKEAEVKVEGGRKGRKERGYISNKGGNLSGNGENGEMKYFGR